MKIRIIKGVVAKMAPRSKGEELEVTNREGRLLIAMGKAAEVLQVKLKTEPAKPKAEKPKPVVKKKTVKRKKQF